MSFFDEDEIPEDMVLGDAGIGVGTIIEATLSHRRSVLRALGSAGLVAVGRRHRDDFLQQPESDQESWYILAPRLSPG